MEKKMCNNCLECMTLDRNQKIEHLDKIARYLINTGIPKTDDMLDEEIPDYVIEVFEAMSAEIARLKEALKPFADIPCLENFDDDQLFDPAGGVYARDVREARAALRGEA